MLHNKPITIINHQTTVINHLTTNHQESSDVETLSNRGRGGSSNASNYWLRPQIFISIPSNIETTHIEYSIAWNIENFQNVEYWDHDRFNSLKYWENSYWILRQIHIQNVEYWEQDTFKALIIEKDFKAKTTLYCGSAADIMIEFIFWIFRVWISKLRVRCSKFRGHISEFGFLSSEFKLQSSELSEQI